MPVFVEQLEQSASADKVLSLKHYSWSTDYMTPWVEDLNMNPGTETEEMFSICSIEEWQNKVQVDRLVE